MKLTWTFFPKPGSPVTLIVIYAPDLDAETLSGGGYLDRENNTAWVNWETYKRFDTSDVQGRRDAFQRLVTLSKGRDVRRKDGSQLDLPAPQQ